MCEMTRGGGLGSRPKKMYGERLGDGVEYHLMKPTPRRKWYRPVVKYHLRRGEGFMKFLENGSRPQPPTSRNDVLVHTECAIYAYTSAVGDVTRSNV